MEKTKIIFNDTTYSIDKSSLAPATTKLQSHLSAVMNGEGAVINFGGTGYGVDSAKLSTAKNGFISRLGAIEGEGRKVVIGGVEYSIGTDKIASAISKLGTAFSDLSGSVVDGNVAILDEAILDNSILA